MNMRMERPERSFARTLQAGLTALLLSLALAFTAQAESADAKKPNPYTRLNGSWISISGEVKDVSADAFTLDYGDGIVTVEMDDGDRDADGYLFLEGDKVTVNGRIDDDFFETTKIEAGSVYVEKLGTYFYASSVDEEDYFLHWTETPIVVSSTTVQGKVTDVRDDEFVIDVGPRSMTVEVGSMPYNPLDDEGYQKIRTGDFVQVNGKLDDGVFGSRELVAKSVIKLSS